jgi:hypothetical protein
LAWCSWAQAIVSRCLARDEATPAEFQLLVQEFDPQTTPCRPVPAAGGRRRHSTRRPLAPVGEARRDQRGQTLRQRRRSVQVRLPRPRRRLVLLVLQAGATLSRRPAGPRAVLQGGAAAPIVEGKAGQAPVSLGRGAKGGAA